MMYIVSKNMDYELFILNELIMGKNYEFYEGSCPKMKSKRFCERTNVKLNEQFSRT